MLTSAAVITGEENEITIFKCQATVFSWDGAAKQWKERGRGTLKVNRTTPSVGDFGLASDDEGDEKRPAHKKSARLIMRTDGTYVVILNCPIYKDMSLGDEPSANTKQLNIVAQEQNGGLVGLTIRVCNPPFADCLGFLLMVWICVVAALPRLGQGTV